MKNMKWILIAICTQTVAMAAETTNDGYLEYNLLDEPEGTHATYVADSRFTLQNYKVTCPASTTLTASVADGGIAGDHWQLSVTTDGERPVLGVVSSSGTLGEYRSVTVDQFDAESLSAKVEIKYLHGIDNFPARAHANFKCGSGDAVVEDLGQTVYLELFNNTVKPSKRR